jgi:predicted Na+-dependent transporter
MQLIGSSIVFGLPGLLLGLALGAVIRRWAVLAVVAVAGAIAVRSGAQWLANGPGDNDPGVIWAVALVANFIGLLVGAGAARLLGGSRQRWSRR